MQMRPPHFFHNIVNMKHYLLIIVSLFTFSVSHAQFSSVSTNIVGWAAGIFEFAPKSEGADDMSALTDEIIAKLLQ